MSPETVILRIRRVADSDCRQLWRWVNDPVVRAAAFDSRPIPWPEHAAWFEAHHRSPDTFMYIIETDAGQAVGQVRFDVRDAYAEADVSIAAEWRGRGLGTEALRLACRALRREADLAIVAHVRPENGASRRAFEKAGFAMTRSEWVNGHESLRFEFPLNTRSSLL